MKADEESENESQDSENNDRISDDQVERTVKAHDKQYHDIFDEVADMNNSYVESDDGLGNDNELVCNIITKEKSMVRQGFRIPVSCFPGQLEISLGKVKTPVQDSRRASKSAALGTFW